MDFVALKAESESRLQAKAPVVSVATGRPAVVEVPRGTTKVRFIPDSAGLLVRLIVLHVIGKISFLCTGADCVLCAALDELGNRVPGVRQSVHRWYQKSRAVVYAKVLESDTGSLPTGSVVALWHKDLQAALDLLIVSNPVDVLERVFCSGEGLVCEVRRGVPTAKSPLIITVTSEVESATLPTMALPLSELDPAEDSVPDSDALKRALDVIGGYAPHSTGIKSY